MAPIGRSRLAILDSVDEARLRDPKDFERAIRRIGKRIERALQRTHIVITGRTEAWRPGDRPSPVPDQPALGCACESARPRRPRHRGNIAAAAHAAAKRENKHAPFRVVTLEELHGAQVETFAVART